MTMYALFKDGKQISQAHPTRLAAEIEAYKHNAVLHWPGDYQVGDTLVLADGYEVHEAGTRGRKNQKVRFTP